MAREISDEQRIDTKEDRIRFFRIAQEWIKNGFDHKRAWEDVMGTSPPDATKKVKKILNISEVNDYVDARLDELEKAIEITQEWNLKKLKEIANSPDAQYKDQIEAIKTMNTMLGYNAPQKVDMNKKEFSVQIVTFDDGSQNPETITQEQ